MPPGKPGGQAGSREGPAPGLAPAPWAGWHSNPDRNVWGAAPGSERGAGYARSQGGWGKPSYAGRLAECVVGLRMWSDSCAPLDLEVRPEGYKLRKDKGRAYLLSKCPAVGQLLEWVEKQPEPITESRHRDAHGLAESWAWPRSVR